MNDRDPEIKGHRCPACDGMLFVGEGGYITCSWVKCPSPEYRIVLAEVREEEPTPPTPDVGWVGTFEDENLQVTGLAVHRDWFAYVDPVEDQLTCEYIDCCSWEPPPEEAEPDTLAEMVSLLELDPECAAKFGHPDEYDPACCRWPMSCSPFRQRAAAVGVQEPDPQPIGWVTRNKRGDARWVADPGPEIRAGFPVHAVMPAGWRPREQGETP